MVSVYQAEHTIVLKPNSHFQAVSIGFCVMVAMGIRVLFLILPLPSDYTFGDIFGLCFLCLWILTILGMTLFAFSVQCQTVTINNEGVFCDNWFRKSFLHWSAVADWGISYCGVTRRGKNIYELYFSPIICNVKNNRTKKLGRSARIQLIGEEYHEVLAVVVPFCCRRSTVKPFLAADRYHFR